MPREFLREKGWCGVLVPRRAGCAETTWGVGRRGAAAVSHETSNFCLPSPLLSAWLRFGILVLVWCRGSVEQGAGAGSPPPLCADRECVRDCVVCMSRPVGTASCHDLTVQALCSCVSSWMATCA